ncbi:MAG: hypothetical protein ACRDQ7_25845, partial [Haloechinothrix sp.]
HQAVRREPAAASVTAPLRGPDRIGSAIPGLKARACADLLSVISVQSASSTAHGQEYSRPHQVG